MGRRKVSTTVYLTAEQAEQLHELNARTKVPMAEWIRMGIEMLLAREQAPPPANRVTSGTEET